MCVCVFPLPSPQQARGGSTAQMSNLNGKMRKENSDVNGNEKNGNVEKSVPSPPNPCGENGGEVVWLGWYQAPSLVASVLKEIALPV